MTNFTGQQFQFEGLEMIRSVIVCAAVLFAVPALAQTPPEKSSANAPLCTYDSQTFGDGAYLCAEKSLMLKCSVDGAKASWSTVTDKDLADRCRASVARESASQRRARWHRKFIRQQITSEAAPR